MTTPNVTLVRALISLSKQGGDSAMVVEHALSLQEQLLQCVAMLEHVLPTVNSPVRRSEAEALLKEISNGA